MPVPTAAPAVVFLYMVPKTLLLPVFIPAGVEELEGRMEALRSELAAREAVLQSRLEEEEQGRSRAEQEAAALREALAGARDEAEELRMQRAKATAAEHEVRIPASASAPTGPVAGRV